MKTKIKWTPQRLAILRYLDNNREHPSVDDIYEALSSNFPTMSVATVYNVLEFLKETGKVREIYIDPEKRRFDPIVSDHYHAICVRCKKIFDLTLNFDLPDLSEKLPDFHILDFQFKINVLCPQCKNEKISKVGLRSFVCSSCGSVREAKHRPQKCPICGQKGTFYERKF